MAFYLCLKVIMGVLNVMEIYAKAAFNMMQMQNRCRTGNDGIELQLLTELMNGEYGKWREIDGVINLAEYAKFDIKAVHSPIMSWYGYADVNIEQMSVNELLLDQIFYIANYYGQLANRKTIIIVHSEMVLKEMIDVSTIYFEIRTLLEKLLIKYPYTEIAIENVTPLSDPYNGLCKLSDNFTFENVKLAKLLREELHTDRVGTVLDICHAKMSKRFVDHVYLMLGDMKAMDLSLDKFFAENKDVIKLIHLADAKDHGYGPGRHGTPFNQDNKDTLRNIIALYDEYGYTCPITLEVGESDLLNGENYRTTYKTLLEVLQERGKNYVK